jgi:hypothetical protein
MEFTEEEKKHIFGSQVEKDTQEKTDTVPQN